MTKEEELTAWKFRRHLRLKKKTAAFEALCLCLRFYPWRIVDTKLKAVINNFNAGRLTIDQAQALIRKYDVRHVGSRAVYRTLETFGL